MSRSVLGGGFELVFCRASDGNGYVSEFGNGDIIVGNTLEELLHRVGQRLKPILRTEYELRSG